jgi:hypothetical protein
MQCADDLDLNDATMMAKSNFKIPKKNVQNIFTMICMNNKQYDVNKVNDVYALPEITDIVHQE